MNKQVAMLMLYALGVASRKDIFVRSAVDINYLFRTSWIE